jgi:hypothetical protein
VKEADAPVVVKQTPVDPRPVGYAWLLFLLAIPPACVIAVTRQLGDFMPAGSELGLTLLALLCGLALIIFALVLVVLLAVAVAKGRSRRTVYYLLEILAAGLSVWAVLRLTAFDPYYWHVKQNESRFDQIIKEKTHAGVPACIKLEERDVSQGLVVNGNTFAAIVYSSSEDLGGPAKFKPYFQPDWRPSFYPKDSCISTLVDVNSQYSWRPLYGRYYLVISSVPLK